MASEFRQLVFENDELLEALVDYFGSVSARLPRDGIRSASIAADEVSIELIGKTDSAQQRPYQVPAEDVAIALIGLCRKRGIPLPRGSKKYLVGSGDNLALRIVMRRERIIEIIEDAT
jgi:hypothetical protein